MGTPITWSPENYSKLDSQLTLTLMRICAVYFCNVRFYSSDVVVVQSLSHVWLFVTPWIVACQAPLSSTYLPEFVQIHVHWVSDAINWAHKNLSWKSNYLKSCSACFPRTRRLSFLIPTLNSFQDVLKVSDCSGLCLNPCRARRPVTFFRSITTIQSYLEVLEG